MTNVKNNNTRRYVYPERPVIRKGYKYINDCMCGGVVRWFHPKHKGKFICVACLKTISNDWIEIKE